MRTSCNGCRILRKGCSEDCTIRPCLQWIKSAESQANATVFLAKFYGRAGLLNLLNAGPEHLRPAVFKSLLYEACGRVVDPVHGSVGLMWTGQWHYCQIAVDAVLKGLPIMQLQSLPQKFDDAGGRTDNHGSNNYGFYQKQSSGEEIREDSGQVDRESMFFSVETRDQMDEVRVVDGGGSSSGESTTTDHHDIGLELRLGFDNYNQFPSPAGLFNENE